MKGPGSIVLVGMLTALVASCTSGGQTSLPTPTADIEARFLEIVQDPDFSGRYEETSSATIGTQELLYAGEGSFSGADSESSGVITAGGEEVSVQAITVDGDDYRKQGDGPWLEEPSGHVEEILRRLTSVEEIGTETRDGIEVHHLRPSPGFAIKPSDLGLKDAEVSRFRASIDFYVAQDGTPVAFTITASWVQPEGKVTATDNIELLDLGGGVPSISAPSEVWQTFESSSPGYTLAHPPDWRPSTRAGTQWFFSPGDDRLAILHQPVPSDTTLRQLAQVEAAGSATTFGQPESEQEGVLGGEPALIYTFHYKQQGTPVFAIEAISIHGATGFYVLWLSQAGTERADTAAFNQFLSTFSFAMKG